MNMKRRLKELVNSIAAGNSKYKAMVDAIKGKAIEKIAEARSVRRLNTTTGYSRKNNHPKYNRSRRSTKPLMAGWPHSSGMTGELHSVPAPNIDQVAALEQRIGLKIKVKGGKCYAGALGQELPINATLDEALAIFETATK